MRRPAGRLVGLGRDCERDGTSIDLRRAEALMTSTPADMNDTRPIPSADVDPAPTVPPLSTVEESAADPPSESRGRRWAGSRAMRAVQVLVSVVLVGLIVWYVFRQFTEVSDVTTVIRGLHPAELTVLALVAGWNLFTYWVVVVVATPGLRLRQAAVLTQSTTAVSNAVPAGGAVAVGLTYTMLSSWGFSRSRSTLFVVVTGVWNNFVKLGMPIFAFALLALGGRPGTGRTAAAVTGLGALIAAVVVFAMILRSERFAHRAGVLAGQWASALLRLVRRGPVRGWEIAVTRWRGRVVDLVRHRWLALTVSTLVSHVSLYVVLLTVLRLTGVDQRTVGWAEVLAVFAFARLVTAIPITPGGVGVVELALIAGIIEAGGDPAGVVAAVLLYRVLTFVLPIGIGVGTYLYWRRNRSWRNSAPPLPDRFVHASAAADTTVASAGDRAVAPGRTRAAPSTLAGRPMALLGYAAAATLVIVAASMFVSNGRVGPNERLVFEAVNGLPDALHWPMWVLQLWGVTGTAVVVALIALWRRRLRLAVALVALVPLKLFVERVVVKNLVHRERPGSTVPDAVLRDAAPTGLSFPSGHAIIAFGIATLLTPYLRRRGRIVVWTLAVLNNVSRIYLGAHNPLDVVCGAAIGIFLGCVLTWIVTEPNMPATRREMPS
jgi:putative heme transporter